MVEQAAAGAAAGRGRAPRAVLISADEDLLDEVLRLALDPETGPPVPVPPLPPRGAVELSGGKALTGERGAAMGAPGLDVVTAASRAGAAWGAAPLVIVGEDLAASVAGLVERRRLRRREEVVLLGREPQEPEIWRLAVRMGAQFVAFLPDAEHWLADRLRDLTPGAEHHPGAGPTTREP